MEVGHIRHGVSNFLGLLSLQVWNYSFHSEKTLHVSALSVTCLAYGISWPVRSFMYLDMLNIYMDVIRWKDFLNKDLNSFVELEILCSTMLEWRLAIYAMVFQIFWGCFLFRFGIIHFTQRKLFYSCFRLFLIKWADRGLVVKGRLNTDLFNVR